jgi:dihydroxy-acid dehydratase
VLSLEVPGGELSRRRSAWTPPPPVYGRGYGSLHAAHVLQANDGCDFDFLVRPGRVAEPDAR